jgi:hypothetical protein
MFDIRRSRQFIVHDPNQRRAMGRSPGNEIAAWLSLILVVAISMLGIGREALRT